MKRPAEEGLDKLDGAKKPIFLTKAERLQISRKEIGFRTNHASSSDLRDDRERRRERDRSACTDRDLERGTHDRQNREEELKKVLELYLSSKEQDKRRVVKFNDQRRFCFDWDGSEDTSLGDKNDLYGQPHQAGLLFGRGFRAGIDKREQKKQFAAKFKNDNRHWSQKKLNEMTDRDWRIFKEDFDICYKGNGSKIPHPMRSWDESHLTTALLKAVDNAGYKNPSPIQMAAIPLGLRQRDLIATAQTGSGKTAAFVLPMLSYVSRLEQHEPLSRREESGEAQGPYALVLAPTRELAQQIEVETTKFARFLNIRIICIVGGHDQRKERQSMEVAKGCEVVIATPGRLLDCLESHYLVLNRCNYVVLDEADRMIDMGFEPQVRGILDAMPSSNLKPVNNHEELDDKIIYRTTHMFSATMPPTVERLARKYLRNPVVVNIGTTGQASRLIKENAMMIKESEKMSLLQKLLQHELRHGKTAIVFVNTHRNADKVSNDLERANYQVTTLHGQMRQEERRASLDEFRSKRCPVLVATDVAGRGIDIPDVAHVINYDMPGEIQAYTHRIGRTGRAGKEGLATTFSTLNDKDVFYDLKQKLNENKSHVPPELANHPATQSKPGTIADRPPKRNDKVYAC